MRREAGFFSRHRVVAAAAPRMAAANPLCRQNGAGHRAMFAQRVNGINRTRRREAAAGRRAKQKSLRRGERELVGANEQRQDANDE